MTTALHALTGEEVADFLTSLFGLPVSAAETEATCDSVGGVGTYVTDAGEVEAHILCDFEGAAKLGAALTQVPMGGVEDSIKEGVLTDNLKENLDEVFNILVSIFAGRLPHRVVLRDVTTPESVSLPEDAVCIKLDIQRYGECRLFVYTA